MALLGLLVLTISSCGTPILSKPLPKFSYRPAETGTKTLPPEPVNAKGVPALMTQGALRTSYLTQMAHHLDVWNESAPTEIGFFGSVVSVSRTRIVVTNQGLSNPDSSGKVLEKDTFAGHLNAAITVVITRSTDVHLLSGGISRLRAGSQVFVGGEQQNNTVTAQVIGSAGKVLGNVGSVGSPTVTSNTDSGDSPSVTTSGGPDQVEEDYSTAGRATDLSPISTSSATPMTNGVNTIMFSGSALYAGIDPHFDASIGSANRGCSVYVSTEWLEGFGIEFHWPFQVQLSGDGFTVVPLDHPPSGSYQIGPVSGSLSLGNLDDYSVYSAWGAAVGITLNAQCSISAGPITGVVNFGLGTFALSFAWQNETYLHMPLTGQPPLTVPPTSCVLIGLSVSRLTFGLVDCQYQNYNPAPITATILGEGGQAQSVSLGYADTADVQNATDPTGGPVIIGQFDYTPALTVKMTAGLVLDLSLNPKEAESGADEENSDGVNYSSDRNPDQVGPTLADGEWQDGQTGLWRNANGSFSPIKPTQEEITAGSAHWVHPGQRPGGTLTNGDWIDSQGRWRNPQGQYTTKPTTAERADVTPGTEAGDKDGEGDKKDKQVLPEVAKDASGWNYETKEAGPVQLPDVTPEGLLLQLPVLPAPLAVSACAFQNYALSPGASPLPVPSYPHVPQGISLPPGTAIYGAEAGNISSSSEKLYILGPIGLRCTGGEGMNGGIGLELTANGSSSAPALVSTLYSTGGAQGQSYLACPFIAQAASSPESQGLDCTPPTGAITKAVSTALSGTFIALVSEPPQPGDADYQTLELVTYQTQSSAPYGVDQETSCSLSPSQRSVCAASLAWFLSTQSTVGGELSTSTLKAVLSEIVAFSRQPTS